MTDTQSTPDIDLVDLANAHVTQHKVGGKKGPWVVLTNIHEEELGQFPGNIPDQVMMDILRFARKYELIALNAGIEFQKGKQNALLLAANKHLVEQIKAVIEHSDKLAERLDTLTKGNA